MPRSKLRLSLPEETWIHDVSTDHPEIVFRVVAVLSSHETGIALLEIRTPDPVPIITEIDRREDITDLELLWKQDDTTLVQVETTNPLLLFPILKAGIPLKTPFEITDGVSTWELTTSSARLSELGNRLTEAGIDFDIDYVRDEPADPADTLLTDRQREVVLTALKHGYYDTPRGATLTEVAEALGVSKATGSDVLHRAEGKILKWFIDEHVAADGIPV